MRGSVTRSFRTRNHRSLLTGVAGSLASCLALVVLPSCVDSAASDNLNVAGAGPTSHYLELALETEKFIDSLRAETEHGATWQKIPEPEDEAASAEASLSLYRGTPGIVLFYLELAEVTLGAHEVDLLCGHCVGCRRCAVCNRVDT